MPITTEARTDTYVTLAVTAQAYQAIDASLRTTADAASANKGLTRKMQVHAANSVASGSTA